MQRRSQGRAALRRSIRPPGIGAALIGALLIATLCAPAGLFADSASGAVALTNVRIVAAPGEVIENGAIVLRDGVIVAVGADVEVPAGAKVYDHEGAKTVYPGLIETYLPQSRPEVDDDIEPRGGHDNLLVRPERDVALYLDDGSWKRLREAGFTAALVAPSDGLFRGRSALVHLGDDGIRANVLRRGVQQNVTLRIHPEGEYPDSMMGAVALFRQTLYDARWYETAHDAWMKNPAQARPHWNTALEALADAASGEERIVFETRDPLETLRVGTLIREFGLDAWLVGHGREYERLDEVVALGAPVLLTVDFPDAPELGEEDHMTVSLEDLRRWDEAPANPAKLQEAGVVFAVTSFGLSEAKAVHGSLAAAIEAGLTPDQALASVTTTPARLLGVSDRLGTIAAGKAAHLVVVDGELFVEQPKITELWIDGRRHEIKESKPPAVDPAGKWEVTIDAGDNQLVVMLELVGTVEDLSGSIGAGPISIPLTDVGVSGDVIEYAFDGTAAGFPGMFTFQMTQEGEKASGAGEGPPGPFSFTAKRVSKPAPEVER